MVPGHRVHPAVGVAGRTVADLALPVIALAIGSIAAIAQQLRNSVVTVFGQDYVRTLRSRGLSRTASC